MNSSRYVLAVFILTATACGGAVNGDGSGGGPAAGGNVGGVSTGGTGGGTSTGGTAGVAGVSGAGGITAAGGVAGMGTGAWDHLEGLRCDQGQLSFGTLFPPYEPFVYCDSAISGVECVGFNERCPDADGGVGGTGGSTDAGDASVDADADADSEICPTGKVTFEMSAGSWHTYCANTCNAAWFSIRPPGGDPYALAAPCMGCMDAACPFSTLGAYAVTTSWDGTYYVYKNCQPFTSACVVEKHCAPPGKYIATWTAYAPNGSCNEPSYSMSHEATFDWPATTSLWWAVGGPVDGG
jgi:hypothetical protein